MTRILSWPGHGWIAMPMRWYLGYVFIAACLHKIAHPEAFAVDVATYEILPLSLVNIMAIVLPWIELFAGVMLIFGFKARAAAALVFGMMLMFIVALALALQAGLDMSCGCFASQAAAGEDPISYKTVLRDTGWLALSVYVLGLDRRPVGIDRWLDNRRKAHA
jgi:putative oxidoreductase